ncbi:nonstructural protein [Chiqui virus]|uniref:nonstructural protein n=1 Tax=Chiqui virus TaxID=2250219 RepID=UPI000DC75DA9|nr:nonstructural protein [Chiqui virus]AWX66226.1 nonstructural protein [Chiqui virus]
MDTLTGRITNDSSAQEDLQIWPKTLQNTREITYTQQDNQKQQGRKVQKSVKTHSYMLSTNEVLQLHEMLIKIYNRHKGTLPNPKAIANLLNSQPVKMMIESKVKLSDDQKRNLTEIVTNTLANWTYDADHFNMNKQLRRAILNKHDLSILVMDNDDLQSATQTENTVTSITMALTIEEVAFLSNYGKGKSCFVLYTFNGPRFAKYIHPVYTILSQVVPTISLSDVKNSLIDTQHPYYKARFRTLLTFDEFNDNQSNYRKVDVVIITNSSENKQKVSSYTRKGWKFSQNKQTTFYWTMNGLTYAGYPLYFMTKITPSDYRDACVSYGATGLVNNFKIHPNFYLLLNSYCRINFKPIVSALTRSRISYISNKMPVMPTEDMSAYTKMTMWLREVDRIHNGTESKLRNSSIIIIADKGSGKTTCTKYLLQQLRDTSPSSKTWGRVDSDAFGKWLSKRRSMGMRSTDILLSNWQELDALQNDESIPTYFAHEMEQMLLSAGMVEYGFDPLSELRILDEFRPIIYTIINDEEEGLAAFYNELDKFEDLPIGLMLESHTDVEISKMFGTGHIVTLDAPYNAEAAVADRKRSKISINVELMLFRAWSRLRVSTYPMLRTQAFFDTQLLAIASDQETNPR